MPKVKKKSRSKLKSSFVHHIFRKKIGETNKIQFGKFTDRNKSPEQLKALIKADELFEAGEYYDAVEQFFYFVRDERSDSLLFDRNGNSIEFSFFQGSKIIKGAVRDEVLIASAEILRFKECKKEFFEHLLQINHSLKFTKFAIDEQKVVVYLHLPLVRADTDILYYALREIAIVADKYDDLFFLEFENLEAINVAHVKELDEKEFQTKVEYLKRWINQTLKEAEKLSPTDFAGARSFMFLSVIYKILYLINPQGRMYEELKNTLEMFFLGTKNVVLKNRELMDVLIKISNEGGDFFKSSLYYVSFTFPENLMVDEQKAVEFAKKEVRKIYWYESNGYKSISQSILEYIAGYILFEFSNLPIIDELLSIFWRVLCKEYYEALGIRNLPFDRNNISYFQISREINTINSAVKSDYPHFYFNVKHLNFENRYEFAKTFIHEFLNLKFE